jgi:hypothetical protein
MVDSYREYLNKLNEGEVVSIFSKRDQAQGPTRAQSGVQLRAARRKYALGLVKDTLNKYGVGVHPKIEKAHSSAKGPDQHEHLVNPNDYHQGHDARLEKHHLGTEYHDLHNVAQKYKSSRIAYHSLKWSADILHQHKLPVTEEHTAAIEHHKALTATHGEDLANHLHAAKAFKYYREGGLPADPIRGWPAIPGKNLTGHIPADWKAGREHFGKSFHTALGRVHHQFTEAMGRSKRIIPDRDDGVEGRRFSHLTNGPDPFK